MFAIIRWNSTKVLQSLTFLLFKPGPSGPIPDHLGSVPVPLESVRTQCAPQLFAGNRAQPAAAFRDFGVLARAALSVELASCKLGSKGEKLHSSHARAISVKS